MAIQPIKAAMSRKATTLDSKTKLWNISQAEIQRTKAVMSLQVKNTIANNPKYSIYDGA